MSSSIILPKTEILLSTSPQLREIIVPFHKVAGVDFIAFTRVYADHTLLDMVDNQKIIEHFYYGNNDHFEDLAPDICPEMLAGEYFLIQCYDIDNPSLQYLHKDLSLSHVLTITNKIDNHYYETFWFGSGEELKFVNFVINNKNEFDTFIRSFKQDQKIKSLIKACEADKITRYLSNEVKIKNQNFISKHKIMSVNNSASLSTEGQYYSPITPTIYLTKREKECLDWCAAGKTNEEIGLILQLSRRTVDHHVERIKYKLDCFNKISMIRKAIKLKLIED